MAAISMSSSRILRRALQPDARRNFARGAALSIDASNVPRVASPSLWHSLIPKAFRQPDDPVSVAERQRNKANKSKDWNPATFFIAMAILIGSNAIQMIALRNERLRFTRKTDAKLSLLKETIERVRRGEDVDVEKTLGTGDPAKEQEWDEVMKEIENSDALWQSKRRKREQRAQEQAAEQASTSTSSSSVSSAQSASSTPPKSSSAVSTDGSPRPPGFY